MVLANGINTISSVQTGGSGGGGAAVIRRVDHKPEETKAIEIPKSKIKYHKIKKHEKYRVKGSLPENYISDIKVPKTNIDNMMKLSSKYKLVSFKIIDQQNDYYLDTCYMIDDISSPVRHKGEGTKAVRVLIEKAVSEKDIDGRVVVDVKITDGETSAAGFFYKLGFRFLDKYKNEAMEDWIKGEKNILSPKIVGLMYLPKENQKKILMYKILL